jgi:hypothetical protein
MAAAKPRRRGRGRGKRRLHVGQPDSHLSSRAARDDQILGDERWWGPRCLLPFLQMREKVAAEVSLSIISSLFIHEP